MALSHIHVLGQGAIGSTILAKALKQGLCCSSEVRAGGSTSEYVIDTDNSKLAIPKPLTKSARLPANSLIILPLKAYQVMDALEDLSARVTASNAILLLHNGMLDINQISALLPAHNLFAATTTYAAKRSGKHIVITGNGATQLGIKHSNEDKHNSAQQLLEVQRLLNLCMPAVTLEQDIDKILWRKLIVNAVINPLTAIHAICNGELTKQEFAQPIQHIIKESVAVAAKYNIHFHIQAITQLIYEVINSTANNHSSMYQDIAFGRPSEINYINGYIVAMGKAVNLPTPYNLALLNQVSALHKA